jgi:hypothetical protein
MSLLGVAAAGVTGFFTMWNPSAMAAAYAVGSGVDAYTSQPDRYGPRLDELRTQMSVYGNPIPFEYGTNRHAGTVIWPKELVAVEHEQTESAKGGPEQHTFTYTLSCAVLVCEGPIDGIRRIWANKKIIYDVSIDNAGATQDPAIGSIRFYLGTETQDVDPLIEATDGASPAYLGYAYVVFENYDVTELNGRPPQWEFEVITDGDTDIPDASTFGEYYSTGRDDAIATSDMDSNGHLWLTTMTGHAVFDPETGTYTLDPSNLHRPQIQEYDAATKTLLWYMDVPYIVVNDHPQYAIQGKSVYSGGYYFIGRGLPGSEIAAHDEWGCGVPTPFTHGYAVNTTTRHVVAIYDDASSGQFDNIFYWPAIPIPVVDNNKVYFASNNGITGGFSSGFMPSSVMAEDGSDYDPIPDRTGSEDKWVTVLDMWSQTNPKRMVCGSGGGVPPDLTSTAINFPGWAYKSTVIQNPNAVIVQGYAGGFSYLAWVFSSSPVTRFDLIAAEVSHVIVPGSAVIMPPIVWDSANETLWVFAGSGNNQLHAVTRGAGSITYTGFAFPLIPGQLFGDSVRGATVDQATGLLRLVIGGGFGDPTRLLLFDPITQSIIEEMTIGTDFAHTTGKMWDMPGQKKVIYVDGYNIHDIPYGTALDNAPVVLADIVSDLCARATLEADDIDVAELIDQVDGYIVPHQMAARAAIEPLQQAYYFDCVESEDKVRFIKRGSATVTTIPAADRAAHEAGSEMPANLDIRRAFETELPVRVDVEYSDLDADHQIGSQGDSRITKDTRHRVNIQLPIVMPATKAKEIARTQLYQAWQNNTFHWTTTRKYAFLEPTDIVLLPTDSAIYRARITSRRDQPNGIIEWEGIQESVEVYTQTGADAMPPPYSPQTVFEPSATVLALMDIPLLRDEDDNAGFYVAMGGQL